jgi:hypothetical protein
MDDSTAGQEQNPLIEFGRMDAWPQLSVDIRLMRNLLRDGLSPKEVMAAFRGDLCPLALRTRTRTRAA